MSSFSWSPLQGGGSTGVTSVNSLTGALTLAAGTGITITPSGNTLTIASTSTTDVTLTAVGSAPNANGASLSGQALTLQPANTSFPGVLLAADWNTFNSKQAAGNYITALTGDATAAGPGSVALTLATVNSNVGSFGGATAVSTFTVNGKGLLTAAGSTSIQIAESQVTNLVSDLAGKQATGNYITALTGDITASGPGSVASTLATVNSNVGSFTNASITVNGKGLITAASNGSTSVTAVSVASANGFTGTSSGGATPALTLATSITGVLKGNGTAISAAVSGTDYAITNDSMGLYNLGLATTVGSNAMTVNLKQADGSSAPSTGASAVALNLRSSTALTAATITRTVTGVLSIVIPSGATLGATSNVENLIYVYAIDNAGTIELAVSAALLDERTLTTTVAITSGSTSGSILYSTTLRSSVPIRLIGRIRQTQTTAGTYAANATEVAVATLNAYIEPQVEYSQTSTTADLVTSPAIGSWNQPTGITGLQVPPGTYDIFLDGTCVLINPTASSSCLMVAQVGTSNTGGSSLLDVAHQIGIEARNGASPNTVPFNFAFAFRAKRQSFTTNTTLYVNQRVLTVSGSPVPTNSGFQIGATGNGVAVRLVAVRVGPP